MFPPIQRDAGVGFTKVLPLPTHPKGCWCGVYKGTTSPHTPQGMLLWGLQRYYLSPHTPRDAAVGFTKVLPLPTHPKGCWCGVYSGTTSPHTPRTPQEMLVWGLQRYYHSPHTSDVSRAYNIQYDGSTTEFNVSSSAVRCLPVGNVLRMSNCVIINIYVARRKQYHRLLLSHLPPFNGRILCSGVFTVFGIFLSTKQVGYVCDPFNLFINISKMTIIIYSTNVLSYPLFVELQSQK